MQSKKKVNASTISWAARRRRRRRRHRHRRCRAPVFGFCLAVLDNKWLAEKMPKSWNRHSRAEVMITASLQSIARKIHLAEKFCSIWRLRFTISAQKWWWRKYTGDEKLSGQSQNRYRSNYATKRLLFFISNELKRWRNRLCSAELNSGKIGRVASSSLKKTFDGTA